MAGRSKLAVSGAVAGGIVLIAGVVAFTMMALTNGGQEESPTSAPSGAPSSSASADPSAEPSEAPSVPSGDVVDPSVSERGWVPEPITQDPEAYATAMLEAAGTFDTRTSTRQEFVDYLTTWFMPEYYFTDPEDDEKSNTSTQRELTNDVVLPEGVWDQLAAESGRVASTVTALEVRSVDHEIPERISYSGTVEMAYAREGGGQTSEYTETVTVSVQVECSPHTSATTESGQKPGDCKAVRWYGG